MSGSVPRQYWDANCFIKYLEADAIAMPTLETLMHNANRARTIQIATSVLSVMEVAFTQIERLDRALYPAEEAALDRLWTAPGILLVEFNERVARLAREIRRDDIMVHGYRTKNFADVVHLATARYIQAAEVNSYDGGFLRYNMRYGLRVREPFVPMPRLPHT